LYQKKRFLYIFIFSTSSPTISLASHVGEVANQKMEKNNTSKIPHHPFIGLAFLEKYKSNSHVTSSHAERVKRGSKKDWIVFIQPEEY